MKCHTIPRKVQILKDETGLRRKRVRFLMPAP